MAIEQRTSDALQVGDIVSLHGVGEHEVIEVKDGWVRTPDLPGSPNHWHNVAAGHVQLVRRRAQRTNDAKHTKLERRVIGTRVGTKLAMDRDGVWSEGTVVDIYINGSTWVAIRWDSDGTTTACDPELVADATVRGQRVDKATADPVAVERERAARHCDVLAHFMETGAGPLNAPGARLRQAAQSIREGKETSLWYPGCEVEPVPEYTIPTPDCGHGAQAWIIACEECGAVPDGVEIPLPPEPCTDYPLPTHDLPELLRILEREHLEVSGGAVTARISAHTLACLTDVVRALVHRSDSATTSDAELDSPPFRPAALDELAARDYRRVNAPRANAADEAIVDMKALMLEYRGKLGRLEGDVRGMRNVLGARPDEGNLACAVRVATGQVTETPTSGVDDE